MPELPDVDQVKKKLNLTFRNVVGSLVEAAEKLLVYSANETLLPNIDYWRDPPIYDLYISGIRKFKNDTGDPILRIIVPVISPGADELEEVDYPEDTENGAQEVRELLKDHGYQLMKPKGKKKGYLSKMVEEEHRKYSYLYEKWADGLAPGGLQMFYKDIDLRKPLEKAKFNPVGPKRPDWWHLVQWDNYTLSLDAHFREEPYRFDHTTRYASRSDGISIPVAALISLFTSGALLLAAMCNRRATSAAGRALLVPG
eukprot:gnl/TRDRNA2_/TRDRNA2_146086_c0_seq2.p1 gnl/TRDRNA2_/TRDRNA2_146086_c0~~gnl/TRDRNA2_/TRDRNA2_146086_c0_seq2.p1  ORF type:complete len:256 (+),score=39.40 gnl/TRDRNA2_/TRDRNA2_146086_c0_seq2:79-846(+)